MFAELNPQQQAAVDHTGSPLLIVAGAGTGKTKTLAARVVPILDGGADPSRVLLLTFPRRAAAEMIGRVTAVSTNRSASEVWGGTFHAIANRLLRHHGESAGLSPGFTVLDQGDSTDLMGMVRTEEGFGERGRRFPRKETVAGIYSRMVSSQAKLDAILEADYPWCADHTDDLRTIFTAYTARKRTHEVLDFDDLLLFWRGLTAGEARGEAGNGVEAGRLRGLFDHILIDEYQDTNPIQADIMRPDLKMCGSVMEDASADAVIGPMPGVVSRRRLSWLVRCQAWIRFSASLISRSSDSNCRTSPSRQVRASAGMRSSSPSVTIASSFLSWGSPTRATTPSSAMCARSALTSMVRWRTRISRVRCTINTLCRSALFTATKRMVGRVTASQIASASAASFLFRFT